MGREKARPGRLLASEVRSFNHIPIPETDSRKVGWLVVLRFEYGESFRQARTEFIPVLIMSRRQRDEFSI